METYDKPMARSKVIFSNSERIPSGEADVHMILNHHEPIVCEQYLIDCAESGTSYLWLHDEIALPIQSTCTLREAVDTIRTALSTPNPKPVVVAYRSALSMEDDNSITIATLLPTIPLQPGSAALICNKAGTKFPGQSGMAGYWTPQRRKAGNWHIASAVAFILGIVLLFGVWSMDSYERKDNQIWQRYNVTGSIGPRYQLQFSYQNVSTWAQANDHSDGKWYLRIDDQAMIPNDLVDDAERHYQAWFQHRYPEMNAIRLNGEYLQEDFLSDPTAIQVLADKTFHMAHCVRALRRYWQARESGRHVCPRDIDYQHMKHCLDSLDEWAFPEGPRGTTSISRMGTSLGGDGRARKDTTRLVWKTKVCFD